MCNPEMQGNTRKLAFPLRMSLVRADQRRLPRPRGAWTQLIYFRPVEHHIEDRAQSRLRSRESICAMITQPSPRSATTPN